MICWGLIILDDLSHDFKNPMDATRTLNKIFVPEYCVQFSIFFLSLITFRYVILLINLPLVLYMLYRYIRRAPNNSKEIYDSTTILNQSTLKRLNIEHWLKITFHLILFLVYAIGSLIYFILYLTDEY
ncbi:hypothetical protein LOD99_5902 [Oopsacas minuta]|uniref:Cornichon n=1 Tax=Oopsacas minuta TaxID=111878 RepID=A0AAV7JQ93_9METZ|nr:hypothetical protein LOD99_5902 [Oopsacas minuta]